MAAIDQPPQNADLVQMSEAEVAELQAVELEPSVVLDFAGLDPATIDKYRLLANKFAEARKTIRSQLQTSFGTNSAHRAELLNSLGLVTAKFLILEVWKQHVRRPEPNSTENLAAGINHIYTSLIWTRDIQQTDGAYLSPAELHAVFAHMDEIFSEFYSQQLTDEALKDKWETIFTVLRS